MNPIKILDRLSTENNTAISFIQQDGYIIAITYFNENMRLQINLNLN